MNEYFEEFYNFGGFGPAIKSITPSDDEVKSYKGILPANLLKYWQEYGFCGWGSGRLWIINPAEYEDILARWLKNTPFEQMQKDGVDHFSVIAIDAFGEIYIWGKNSGTCLSITSCYGMIFPAFNNQDFLESGEELILNLFFANKISTEIDLNDLNDQPLFERALEKLGPLENGEIYGFVPALALGGAPKLENLQKVKATEHLAFLAELGEKRVMADIVALSNALPHNQ